MTKCMTVRFELENTDDCKAFTVLQSSKGKYGISGNQLIKKALVLWDTYHSYEIPNELIDKIIQAIYRLPVSRNNMIVKQEEKLEYQHEFDQFIY